MYLNVEKLIVDIIYAWHQIIWIATLESAEEEKLVCAAKGWQGAA